MAPIKWLQPRVWWVNAENYFLQASGGKTILVLKRAGLVLGGGLLMLAVFMAWSGPKDDKTFYLQTSQPQKDHKKTSDEIPGAVSSAIASLFDVGKKKMVDEKKNAETKKQRKVAIKYFAPQIIGGKTNVAKSIRSGAKLVGFLLNAIDTRSSSAVRVRIAQGGEMGGVEIEKGSVLTGQFSYSGSGDRIFVSFIRLDSPDGEPRKIQAQALDSGDYTAGVSGVVHSDGGAKTAASLGLTMAAGMADVLTEKESLGFSQNGVQAKSTMKNALLQGLSRSAQDQTGRMASQINSVKDYVIIPEGKEVIIELTEDFK